MKYLVFIIVLTTVAMSTQGSLVGIMDQCCAFGQSWFGLSRGLCSRYPANVQNVSLADQMNCASVLQICCLASRRKNHCDAGKEFAKTRGQCDDIEQGRSRNEDTKECCNCCKMGLVARQEGASCTLFSRFGRQCGATFYECCSGNEDFIPITLTDAPTQIPIDVLTTPTPTQDLQGGLDYCAEFGGELCAHICVTTVGSFECRCNEGFTLNPVDKRSCLQINLVPQSGGGRCASSPCEHDCVDTGVAVHCKCWDGFMLQPDGRTCRDIDECTDGIFSCQPQQTCANTEGSYTCVGPSSPGVLNCPAGYAWNSVAYSCEDIDECAINRHSCQEFEDCYNNAGGFDCRRYDLGDEDSEELEVVTDDPGDNTGGVGTGIGCQDGFHYNTLTSSCEDTDECTAGQHDCYGTQEVCRNTFGAYKCDCEVGFEWDRAGSGVCTDINECALGTYSCISGQLCENTIGSYKCRRQLSCGTGYTLDSASQKCVDVDECVLRTHNCGRSRECENTQGSFRCVLKQCRLGYKLDQRTGHCALVNCARGMKADRGGHCIDVNECAQTPSVCRATQECRNTPGSFECRNLVTCGAGLELNKAGTGCQDIDECIRGTHSCRDSLMECINRPGTHICRCPEGYKVNHQTKTCEDIDECQKFSLQICSSNSKCRNTRGSFVCDCSEGFESSDEQSRSCKDVDECQQPHMCHHSCHNSWGSFHCSCRSGYKLATDQRSCTDIDECTEWKGQGQLCVGLCENTQGSYSCACPRGYVLQGERTCVDLNECDTGTANCNGPDDICINTNGGFRCETVTCPNGFVKAPSINSKSNKVRCQRKSFVCGQGDTECLFAPLFYAIHLLSLPSNLQIPADLFTMHVQYNPYRRFEFELVLNSAQDPTTGEVRVTKDFFQLKSRTDYQAVLQLLRNIDGPQDVELQINMNVYSVEFENDEEKFLGTAVAKIKLFITKAPWE